ncbi:MAG: xanthine dehydrogenase family protein molybdopterin-binding subunit [Spirochaetaceae bacterium]
MSSERPLYLHTLRSPVIRGRIDSVVLPEQAEGETILSAEDIPGERSISLFGEAMPTLASESVRYQGEPILLVGARTSERAASLAGMCAVEISERNPRPDSRSYTGEQLVLERSRSWGELDDAMSKAYQIVEGSYGAGAEFHREVAGITVRGWFEERSLLVIETPSQWIHHVAEQVHRATGYPRRRIDVRGVRFGAIRDQLLLFPAQAAVHVALLALSAQQPVVAHYSPEELSAILPARPPIRVVHSSGLDESGNLLAVESEVTVDLGAYPFFSEEICDRLLEGALGTYRSKHGRILVRAIRSSAAPMHGYEGFGSSQGYFALESHINRTTEVAQSEPIGWRLRNSRERVRDSIGQLLSEVADSSDFRRKFAAYEVQRKRRQSAQGRTGELRGVGISFAEQGSGFIGRREDALPGSISLRLDQSGRATLRCSALPSSGRQERLWKRLVAERLSISPDDVSLTPATTRETPDFGPATLSRSTTIMYRLIEQSCAAIQKQRFRSPLPLEVKRTYRTPKRIDWDPRSGGVPFLNTSAAAAVCELAFSPVTYRVRIRGIWLYLDAGRILDPESARHRLRNGVYEALSWSVREYLRRPGAPVLTAEERLLLSTLEAPEFQGEIPPVQIRFRESVRVEEPLGIGELPYSTIPSAFLGALSQASGVYLDLIPTSPDILYGYLAEPS